MGPKSYRDFRETGPRTGIKVNDFVAWDQAPQWEKRQKTGSHGKNIGERNGPSGTFPSPDYLFPPMRSLVPGYDF